MIRAKDDSGQALIVVALSLTCLLGFVALGVEVGLLLNAKRTAQIAADSAAIAGASDINYGTTAIQNAGTAAAAQNGFTSGTVINRPPQLGPHAGAGNTAYVEAIVSQSEPNFLMNLVGQPSMTVSARAVAFSGAPGEGCVYTLGTSGNDILINGTGINVTVNQCSVIDDSSLLINGTSDTLTASSIGVVGGVVENGTGIHVTPTPVTPIIPASNPLTYLNSEQPTPSGCTSIVLNGASGSLSHGCYSGVTINGSNINVTMGSGLYTMTGPFIVNGTGVTVTGSNVTLYFANGASFTDNGSTTLDLSAPTTGAYNGILFWQAQGNSAALTINGSSSSTLDGIIYAPSANVILNGNSSTNLYTSIVASSLTINGSINLNDYAKLPGTSSPITSVALVE